MRRVEDKGKKGLEKWGTEQLIRHIDNIIIIRFRTKVYVRVKCPGSGVEISNMVSVSK